MRNPVRLLGSPMRYQASPPTPRTFELFPILCSYRLSFKEVLVKRMPVVLPCPLPSSCSVLKVITREELLQVFRSLCWKDRSPQSVWAFGILECCRKGNGRGWPQNRLCGRLGHHLVPTVLWTHEHPKGWVGTGPLEPERPGFDSRLCHLNSCHVGTACTSWTYGPFWCKSSLR